MNDPTSTVVPALGIDVGTTNIKVALVDAATGRVCAAHSVPTPTQPEALVDAVRRAVADCLDRTEAGVVSVGVSSMAESGAAFDAADRPLTSILPWSDHRARGLRLETDADAFYAATGVILGPKVPLVKWAWFASREPALWRRVHRWAGVADIVVHALTGEWVTDHTLAGRTGALPLGSTQYDPGLTALGGLEPDRLPRVLTVGENVPTRDEFVAAWGLPSGTPVTIAGHDPSVGAWAVGVRRPGQVADSLGTSEAILAVVDPSTTAPLELAREGMSYVRTVDGAACAVLAGTPTAGALLEWWARSVVRTSDIEDVFRGLEHESFRADEPLVLPYPAGRQAPAPDPRARLDVLGVELGQSDATLASALLSGLALHARWMTESALRGAVPAAPRPPASADGPVSAEPTTATATAPGARARATASHEVTILGGPARNRAWVRRKAEVSPWETRVAVEPHAVVVGAALLGARRAGYETAVLGSRVLDVPLHPAADERAAEFVHLARGRRRA